MIFVASALAVCDIGVRFSVRQVVRPSVFPFTIYVDPGFYVHLRGCSGGAMVLGKLPVPGHPTIWITVGQGPTALVVGAGGGCLDIFTLIYPFLFSFSLSLGDGPI